MSDTPPAPAPADQTPSPLGEIEHGPSAFERFLDQNQKRLLLIAGLLILGLSAYLFFKEMRASHQAKAAAAYAAANDIPTLAEVSKNYPDTPSAGSAQLKISHLQWSEGNQQAALETLRNFLENYPKHPAYQAGQLTLGSNLLALGQPREAEAAFQKVASQTQDLALVPAALLYLGDLARREGQLEEARRYYEQMLSDDLTQAGLSLRRSAQRRLELLKATPPEKQSPIEPTTPQSEEAPVEDVPTATEPTAVEAPAATSGSPEAQPTQPEEGAPLQEETPPAQPQEEVQPEPAS